MMRVVQNPSELQNLLLEKKSLGLTIGFVPTMGALHEGHLSLLDQADEENDIVVLSIYVNPTQFNNTSDFDKYPRTLERDLKKIVDKGVDYVFAPTANSLYPDNYNYFVGEKEKNTVLEGQSRPGHFQGVLTVVLKLLNLTQAHRAYFGEKDYQQLEIIRGMTNALFLPVEIIGCPTVRDQQGLALSSRNERLSVKGVEKARVFANILKTSPTPEDARENLSKEDIKVDYIEELWGRRFGAVFIEDVRLIDNVPI